MKLWVLFLAAYLSTAFYSIARANDPPLGPKVELISIQLKAKKVTFIEQTEPANESEIKSFDQFTHYFDLVYRVTYPNSSRQRTHLLGQPPSQEIIAKGYIFGEYKKKKISRQISDRYVYFLFFHTLTSKQYLLRYVRNPQRDLKNSEPYAEMVEVDPHFDSTNDKNFGSAFQTTSPPADRTVFHSPPASGLFCDELNRIDSDYYDFDFEEPDSSVTTPQSCPPDVESESSFLKDFSRPKSDQNTPSAPDLAHYLETTYPLYVGVKKHGDLSLSRLTPLSMRYQFEIELLKSTDITHLSSVLQKLAERLVFILDNSDEAYAQAFLPDQLLRFSGITENYPLQKAIQEYWIRFHPANQALYALHSRSSLPEYRELAQLLGEFADSTTCARLVTSPTPRLGLNF